MTEPKSPAVNQAATPAVSQAAVPPAKRPFKQRALIWLSIAVTAFVVFFIVYRWGGTSVYRGTVQRVYEQSNDYRAEIVDLEGNTHVVGNREIMFPYFKLNTADLHADLNRLSKTHDIVEVRVWGFRLSWFSIFPNLIDTTFVMSRQDRDQQRAERIADAVVERLQQKGLLKDAAAKGEIVDAVKTSLAAGAD
ncbi:MAG TPA: DUF1523 family protein [Polyangiaceae bacterium]|nr:DUF1523 family protein [Polyangiaceae bacterium]